MKLEFPTISKFFYPTRNGLGRKMLIKRLKSSCPPNVIISNIKINLSAYAPPIFSPFFHIHMYCASVQFLQVTVTITLPICPHVSEGHFRSSKAYSLVNFFPQMGTLFLEMLHADHCFLYFKFSFVGYQNLGAYFFNHMPASFLRREPLCGDV